MHYVTTAHQTELNAAAKMRSWGLHRCNFHNGRFRWRHRRPLSLAPAQEKWRGGVADRPDMRRLCGARGTDTTKELLFFSASGYNKQALDYANQMGIGLYSYDPVGAVTAVNRAAARIMAKTRPRHTPWGSASISCCTCAGWWRSWWLWPSRCCSCRGRGNRFVHPSVDFAWTSTQTSRPCGSPRC